MREGNEVLEVTVQVMAIGELIHYHPQDLDWVDAPDDSLKDVCDRVTRLWSVPNLPKSVQHLSKDVLSTGVSFLAGRFGGVAGNRAVGFLRKKASDCPNSTTYGASTQVRTLTTTKITSQTLQL